VTTPNALEVEGLSVSFGRSRVLADVSFVVPEGGTLAVIGPNGSGKTILFKALIGAVTEGMVRWAGHGRVRASWTRARPADPGIDFLQQSRRVPRGRVGRPRASPW
jgi:ABC-type branched-subunit amino acid transport system ATPase component